MDAILEQLLTPYGIRAIIASSLVGIMCGALGAFIVLRNMALIGDALAHAILPGVFVSFVLVGYNVIGFFIGSVFAGLITAYGITWVQKYTKTKNDAAIGIVFSTMFAIGVMGITHVSKKGVHLDLQDFLFGTVLGISTQDIMLITGVTIYVLVSIYVFYRYLFITTFQPTIAKTIGINVHLVHYFLMFLLSFAVVSAMRSVGVILVVSMLITPAAIALLWSDRLERVIVISAIIGLVSANIGMFLAIIFDTNPGPAMTVTVTLFYVLTVFFSPKKGLFFNYIRKRKEARKIEREDILKQAIKGPENEPISIERIARKLGYSKVKIKKSFWALVQRKLIEKNSEGFFLTTAGKHHANELVRAHRLWESYLVTEMGMSEQNIHEEAERFEHFISKELLDEVDTSLGYPKIDPHGSPIPQKATLHLAQGALDKTYVILKDQSDDLIDAKLWDLGVLPNESIKIYRKTDKYAEIYFQSKRIRIPLDLAHKILIQ